MLVSTCELLLLTKARGNFWSGYLCWSVSALDEYVNDQQGVQLHCEYGYASQPLLHNHTYGPRIDYRLKRAVDEGRHIITRKGVQSHNLLVFSVLKLHSIFRGLEI